MPNEAPNPDNADKELIRLEEKAPPVSRHVVSRDMMNYNPDENEHNLRDDIENSSFPSLAQLPSSPAARLLEAAMIHGNYEALKILDSYFIEFEMRRVPMDHIARHLDVSVSVARKFFNGYKERQRRAIERLEVNDVLSKSLNALDELGSKLYRIGTEPTEAARNRIAALRAAGDIEIKKLESLERNRFYERKGYAGQQSDEKDTSKRPQFLMNIMQNIFTGQEVDDGDKLYKDMESAVLEAEVVESDNEPSSESTL